MTAEYLLQILSMSMMTCLALSIWLYVFGHLLEYSTFRKAGSLLFAAAYSIFILMGVAVVAHALKIF